MYIPSRHILRNICRVWELFINTILGGMMLKWLPRHNFWWKNVIYIKVGTYIRPRLQSTFKKIALASHDFAGIFFLIWFVYCTIIETYLCNDKTKSNCSLETDKLGPYQSTGSRVKLGIKHVILHKLANFM